MNLGLRRTFQWIFIIADVSHAILGADFLSHFGLLPDVRNRRLMDLKTWLGINGMAAKVPSISPLYATLPQSQFTDILQDFPDLTKQRQKGTPAKHNVVHHILTSGPPTTSRARRLEPNCFKIAKQELKGFIIMNK